MKNHTVITLILGVLLLSACSTTACLEEGEQLYVGLKEVTYNKAETQKSGDKGVITAVSDAVEKVENIIRGNRAEVRAARAQQEQYAAVVPEVDAVLACEPNGALFGSSSIVNPLNLRLRIYNKYHDTDRKFGRWMLRTFGAEPVLISTVSPQTRVKVATNQLHNYGYFRAQTTYEVIPTKNPKKAKLAYHIQTGPLYLIDSIRYERFTPQIDSLLRTTRRRRLLKKGSAFSAANLANERTRIDNLLRENGYYYFTPSVVKYQADTIRNPLHVSMRVLPDEAAEANAMRPWKMGRTYVTLFDNTTAQLDTILPLRFFDYAFHGKKPPLKAVMWRRALMHRRGQPYRLSDQTATLEKITGMGVLSQVSLEYLPASDSPTCDTLNTYISATMDKLYESSLTMNATLKSNHQFGPGISYELAKRNAFRGGEKVAWKIFGQYEWNIGKEGGKELNSYELGSELSLTFPRLMLMKHNKQRFAATTKFALDVDWRNRSGFFNMVQWGVHATYDWTTRRKFHHELTAFDLEFDRTLSTTDLFQSIVQANPALYVTMRNQFVPSVGYVFTYASASQKNPFWVQATGKEAGNLTAGIYSACGGRWTERDKTVMGSPFAQFVRLTAETHKSWTLSSRLLLASRVYAGAVFTYGNSTAAPYSELFYVGGANSVRGFAARSIGPGGYRSAERRYAYIDQMGDIKLEANLELRARLFADLHGAVFLDAGNTWLMHNDPLRPESQFSASNLKRIALGTGLGLRYDLTFLVLRLDFGIGLHAPYDSSRKGFYNIERFRDGCALHLAIGYPF